MNLFLTSVFIFKQCQNRVGIYNNFNNILLKLILLILDIERNCRLNINSSVPIMIIVCVYEKGGS